MNKFVLIKVKNNIKRFINKCNERKIELYYVNYINKDEIIVKIKKEDYKNIKIFNYYCEIDIYKSLGSDSIKEKIFKLKYFILTFIICLLLMYISSNVILKVSVIHSNIKIRELLLSELEDNGIKKYSIKKDFIELENIKNKILDNNKDKLEWISIESIGMTYVIRVEERILDNITDKDAYCNIISNKDALITKIYSDSGEILINVNDFVHKNDILISGDIKLNDGIMGSTCANGEVYGHVWYETNVTLKRNYQKKVYTGRKRLNFTFNHKILRNNKYENYDKDYIIKNRFFTIYKEKEYKLENKLYTEEESLEKALLNIDNKFKSKLNGKGNIISKKVLKKDINNSTIYLEVFVVTEELISEIIK